MASVHDMVKAFLVLMALANAPSVSATPDAGNVIAGLLGALLAIITVLALIGWYARNR